MMRLPAFAIGGWGFVATCVLMTGCFDATRSRKCVSTEDSRVCLVVDGGLINVSANGLEPGATAADGTTLTGDVTFD